MVRNIFTKLVTLGILSILVMPASADALISRQLQVGSRGADVTELQTFLAMDSSIYPEGLVTGYYGPLTRSAVIRFQARHGISQVGRVGPITLSRVNSLYGGIGGSDDVDAPILSGIGIATSTSIIGTGSATSSIQAATITWNTNEDTTGKVYYGTNYPLILDSAATITDTDFDRTKQVILPSLSLGISYFYIIESTDVAGNMQRTVHQTLLTR